MNHVLGLNTLAASSGPVEPGLIAFLVVALLGVALWALLRSMGTQLKRAQEHFEAEEAKEAREAQEAATVPAPGASAEAPKLDSVPAPKPGEDS